MLAARVCATRASSVWHTVQLIKGTKAMAQMTAHLMLSPSWSSGWAASSFFNTRSERVSTRLVAVNVTAPTAAIIDPCTVTSLIASIKEARTRSAR
jgi:hypothetical protein